MQSNPIQQRIELICEKWEEAKKKSEAGIVHIRCRPDESEMVDTFYTYMIASDTPVLDIAFHFDAVCYDPKLFSKALLEELDETIHIWNNSEKDSRIEYVEVNWKPDYSLGGNKNSAALFINNFNTLCAALKLPPGNFAVAILKGTIVGKNLIEWLKDAMEANISPGVKILIHDTLEDLIFQDLILRQSPVITTIPINLDMPKAMEQVAAMGDPNDPATAYRQSFMKMMNEMGAGNEDKAEKSGQECISIANRNLSKDPYWITQIIVIYIALANDKMRYKKKEATLEYANKAVDTAINTKTYLENDIASMLLAQATMFRGSVLFSYNRKADAYIDFNLSFELYLEQLNTLLAIEACRMAGQSALQSGQKENGIKVLVKGARLGNQVDPQTMYGTTYAGILEQLQQSNDGSLISMQELDQIARPIYGADWVNLVKDWKKIPDKAKLEKQELEATEA
ncbi:MAG: hypothetical protein ABIR78_14135 [Ferruginibacter sp.]